MNKDFRKFLEDQGYEITIFFSRYETIFSTSGYLNKVAVMDLNDGRFTYFYEGNTYTESQIVRYMKLQVFI